MGDGNGDLKKTTREHLEQFGSAGLRTLCLAYRDLSTDMYEHWNEKFIQAKSSLRDREKKLDEVYPMFGCTLFYFWSFYIWNFFFGQMKMMLLTLFLIIFYSSFQMNYYLTNINNHEIWLQILHCLIVFYIYEYLMFWSWNKNFKAKRRYLEEDKRVPIYSSISPDQYLLLQWIDLEAFLAAHW